MDCIWRNKEAAEYLTIVSKYSCFSISWYFRMATNYFSFQNHKYLFLRNVCKCGNKRNYKLYVKSNLFYLKLTYFHYDLAENRSLHLGEKDILGISLQTKGTIFRQILEFSVSLMGVIIHLHQYFSYNYKTRMFSLT